jgi:hypothetical protein
MEINLTCTICNRNYTYNNKKKTGHTLTKCNSCMANKNRLELKAKINTYKQKGCSICGYNKNTAALQFHHLNPKEKDFEISSNMCRKWKTIEQEIAKCIVVCANCHIELHNL